MKAVRLAAALIVLTAAACQQSPVSPSMPTGALFNAGGHTLGSGARTDTLPSTMSGGDVSSESMDGGHTLGSGG